MISRNYRPVKSWIFHEIKFMQLKNVHLWNIIKLDRGIQSLRTKFVISLMDGPYRKVFYFLCTYGVCHLFKFQPLFSRQLFLPFTKPQSDRGRPSWEIGGHFSRRPLSRHWMRHENLNKTKKNGLFNERPYYLYQLKFWNIFQSTTFF